jgi:hypothetical protein
MRAVVCQNAELDVVERPEPTRGRGQVRLSGFLPTGLPIC